MKNMSCFSLQLSGSRMIIRGSSMGLNGVKTKLRTELMTLTPRGLKITKMLCFFVSTKNWA